MPVATREAMLVGVRGDQRVIVGAYVDGSGGVCPMLAAHRRGARTDFLAFARSWDRFTRAGRRSRQATQRELRILVTQLEASLSETSGLELDAAIREHHVLRGRTLRAHLRRSQADPTDQTDQSHQGAPAPSEADPPGDRIRARRLLSVRRRRSPAGARRVPA